MHRKLGLQQWLELLSILTVNALGIASVVLWMMGAQFSNETKIDRVFDMGYFGSLFLMSLGIFFVRLYQDKFHNASAFIKILIKRPTILCYLYLIVLKLLQGSHLVLPAANEFLSNMSVNEEMIWTMGFILDIYFLITCFSEVIFRKTVLHYWNIGMAFIYTTVLVGCLIQKNCSDYILLELLAIIIWHLHFCYILIMDKRSAVAEVEELEENKEI